VKSAKTPNKDFEWGPAAVVFLLIVVFVALAVVR
jgi:hypothetical protein